MYIHTSAFENLLPGEPTPEALHRQEYYEARENEPATSEAELIEPSVRQRAELLRARIVTGVGRYFA
jgi:hypothetical protein